LTQYDIFYVSEQAYVDTSLQKKISASLLEQQNFTNGDLGPNITVGLRLDNERRYTLLYM
jgi:hypothetical protein